MRTIKFRGLNKPTKEWKYGYLVVDEKYCQIWQEGDVPVPVDIETVGQFTGLNDRLGKEIYEGDIIQVFSGVLGKTRRGKPKEMHWYPLGAGWRAGTDDSDTLFNGLGVYAERNLEVIGNIYEHPELLSSSREDKETKE